MSVETRNSSKGPTNRKGDLRPIGTRFIHRFPPDSRSTDPRASLYTYEVVGYVKVASYPGGPWRWAEHPEIIASAKLNRTNLVVTADGRLISTFDDGSEYSEGNYWSALPPTSPTKLQP